MANTLQSHPGEGLTTTEAAFIEEARAHGQLYIEQPYALYSEENHLGMPLPKGRVRFYKQDDTQLEFTGENVIDHTPQDELVKIYTGNAFDLVGERTRTNFQVDNANHWADESFEIKLRNHKTEPVHVIVKENLYRWTNWEITDCSDKWEKQDYRTIHIPVDVPVDGEKTVTYSVKYTW